MFGKQSAKRYIRVGASEHITRACLFIRIRCEKVLFYNVYITLFSIANRCRARACVYVREKQRILYFQYRLQYYVFHFLTRRQICYVDIAPITTLENVFKPHSLSGNSGCSLVLPPFIITETAFKDLRQMVLERFLQSFESVIVGSKI